MTQSNNDLKKYKVGVFMPCYNLGAFIDDALDSLFKQTFQEFDLIVADDGSTDPVTVRKLNSLKLPHGEVRIEKTNRGLPRLANKFIAELDNEYVVMVSADDTFKPTLLEEMVRYLDSHKDIAAVCTWLELFGERQGIQKFSDNNCKLPEMLIENGFCGASMLRKAAWLKAGKFNASPNLRPHEDYVLWLTMLMLGFKLGVISKPLYNYRIRSDSVSNSFSRKKNLQFKKQLMRHFLPLYRKHCEYVIGLSWDIIEQYDKDFDEYLVGHDWLDKTYKEQLAEIEKLRSRIAEYELLKDRSLLRRAQHFVNRSSAKRD